MHVFGMAWPIQFKLEIILCNGLTVGEYEAYLLAMILIDFNFFTIFIEEHVIAVYMCNVLGRYISVFSLLCMHITNDSINSNFDDIR